MLNNLDKNLIKKRFKKNLSVYEQNAIAQKYMASELLLNLIKYRKDFNKILEIGCGIGTLTNEILNQLNFDELFVNDIVKNSLSPEIQSDKIKGLYGDSEKIPFPQDLDLVISNATFQWLQNLPAVLNKIHSSLNKGGVLAFSTFEESNLYQISMLTQKALNYYTKSELQEILRKNFKVIYSNSQTLEIEFDSAQDVLKHLKLTGVNGLTPEKWTKKDLKEFGDKYNRLFKNANDKLILTYKPVWFICAKMTWL